MVTWTVGVDLDQRIERKFISAVIEDGLQRRTYREEHCFSSLDSGDVVGEHITESIEQDAFIYGSECSTVGVRNIELVMLSVNEACSQFRQSLIKIFVESHHVRYRNRLTWHNL